MRACIFPIGEWPWQRAWSRTCRAPLNCQETWQRDCLASCYYAAPRWYGGPKSWLHWLWHWMSGLPLTTALQWIITYLICWRRWFCSPETNTNMNDAPELSGYVQNICNAFDRQTTLPARPCDPTCPASFTLVQTTPSLDNIVFKHILRNIHYQLNLNVFVILSCHHLPLMRTQLSLKFLCTGFAVFISAEIVVGPYMSPKDLSQKFTRFGRINLTRMNLTALKMQELD